MNQPLDSRQLKAFTVLARTGSFTLAAKELFLTQSAVSHAMKAFEQDVGCRLLDRVGKKVLLTQAGEQLLEHAEKILNEMSVARDAINQLGKWGKCRLRIGASTTGCQYIVPPVLGEFKKSFGDCSVNIEPGDTADLLDALAKNRIDLAIAMAPRGEEQFEFQPLFTDELCFVVSPAHPWAALGHAVRAEIPRQQFITYRKNSYTFRLVEDYFREEEMVLNTVVELGSMEATKELVKLGLGVSVIAPWVAQKELLDKSLAVLPLGRRKLKRSWGVLHWRERRLSLAEETFITLCRKFCETLPCFAPPLNE